VASRGPDTASGLRHSASIVDALERLLDRAPTNDEVRAVRAAFSRSGDVLVSGRPGVASSVTRLIANRREIVGRDRACSVRVFDAFVSHAHLELRHSEGHWYAHDMNSTNGTRLEGELLSGWSRLRHGDVVTLGEHTRLLFLQALPALQTPHVATRFLPDRLLTPAHRRILWAMSLPMRERADVGAATTKAVAQTLGISPETVKTHTSRLYALASLDGRAPGSREILARRGLQISAAEMGEPDHPRGRRPLEPAQRQ
jgi:hypothetical protein